MSQVRPTSPARPGKAPPPGGPAQPPAASAPRPGGRGRDQAGRAIALRNWRVTTRVMALIVIPIVMGTVFAGLRVKTATANAATFGRVQQLAVLGVRVTELAQQMQDECDLTVALISGGWSASGEAALQQQYAATDRSARQVHALARGIGPAYPASTRASATAVLTRISDLPALRGYSAKGQTPALTVVTDYSLATADLFTLDDDIAQEGGNAALVTSVRALGSLSRMQDQAAQLRAILYIAFATGHFGPGAMDAVTAAEAQEVSDFASFRTSATLSEVQNISDLVSGHLVDDARAMEQNAIVTGSTGRQLDPSFAPYWNTAMSYTVGQIRQFERGLSASIVTQAQALHQGALRSAVLTGAAGAASVIGVVLFALIIAGSMVRPLRRLQAGAMEVATVRLPSEVRLLSQVGALGAEQAEQIEPIDVHSTDEIGRVARAFDQVHREAVRLAADEARLRDSVSAMFVSLSRRSQSLLERLLRLIDTLELGEDDPDRLANLFRMDHLATRLRRHSENMLVLAGTETARRLAAPVSLVNVTRAAISEIEQYDRVSVNVQPGITLTGTAVADTVHLLAELIENATIFSPRTAQVRVAGHGIASGGVLIVITDLGMGMTEEQLTNTNVRLEYPPPADVAVSRHMGLFAVAHLAARHGIKVRLQAPQTGGLSAQVWLPEALTTLDNGRPPWDSSQQTAPQMLAQPRDQAEFWSAGLQTGQGAGGPLGAAANAGAASQSAPVPDLSVSEWFRVGHGLSARSSALPGAAQQWSSPGDDGWLAAETVLAPFVGGTTSTGLPQRTPLANLVPGSAGRPAARPVRQNEAAETARSQLAGFQRGSRRARAASQQEDQ